MRRHTITFERLETDYRGMGEIRSVTVDHERRRLIIVADSNSRGPNEGATVPAGTDYISQDDEEI